MALFCQNMLEIAVELAAHDPAYEELAIKFVEHFLLDRPGDESRRARRAVGRGGRVLLRPAAPARWQATRLKVRSMVGSAPAVRHDGGRECQREQVPASDAVLARTLAAHAGARDGDPCHGPGHFGVAERGIFALVNEDRLRRILSRMLDENEFFSPYGIRALSRYHADHPYVFSVQGQEYRVDYLPAESNSGMFGGNSNWRGPIWLPVNALIIRALLQYYALLRRQL